VTKKRKENETKKQKEREVEFCFILSGNQ